MELVSSAWHVISSAIVFVMGAFIVNALRTPFNIKQNRAFLIYLWHTLFCVAYMIFSLEYGADSASGAFQCGWLCDDVQSQPARGFRSGGSLSADPRRVC